MSTCPGANPAMIKCANFEAFDEKFNFKVGNSPIGKIINEDKTI